LAELDDPEAIPALEMARQRERYDRPREHFDLRPRSTSRDPQRWLSTS
jgi:hypothetical protein